MDHRSLVGRRYEDYLKNDIIIELNDDELLWRMIISDPRYNSLVDRRKGARRKTDKPFGESFTVLSPGGSFMFMRGV